MQNFALTVKKQQNRFSNRLSGTARQWKLPCDAGSLGRFFKGRVAAKASISAELFSIPHRELSCNWVRDAGSRSSGTCYTQSPQCPTGSRCSAPKHTSQTHGSYVAKKGRAERSIFPFSQQRCCISGQLLKRTSGLAKGMANQPTATGSRIFCSILRINVLLGPSL